MMLLGVSVALSIQIVGALLVLALLITPAAAALRVTSSPRLVVLLSVVFAVTATVGGILLALGGRLPISPYVTTLSFLIYVVCRVIGGVRASAGHQRAGAAGFAGVGGLRALTSAESPHYRTGRRLALGRAVRAQPEDLHGVLDGGEAVLVRDPRRPGLDRRAPRPRRPCRSSGRAGGGGGR